MAAALEAGLRGEATGPTERLDTDATNVLAAGEATGLMGRTRALPPQTHAPPQRRVEPRQAAEVDRPRKQKRNGLRWFIGILIALLLGAAVALALGLDSGVSERIQEDNSQQQIDELIKYVREHRE
jgi:hypothetical protein